MVEDMIKQVQPSIFFPSPLFLILFSRENSAISRGLAQKGLMVKVFGQHQVFNAPYEVKVRLISFSRCDQRWPLITKPKDTRTPMQNRPGEGENLISIFFFLIVNFLTNSTKCGKQYSTVSCRGSCPLLLKKKSLSRFFFLRLFPLYSISRVLCIRELLVTPQR